MNTYYNYTYESNTPLIYFVNFSLSTLSAILASNTLNVGPIDVNILASNSFKSCESVAFKSVQLAIDNLKSIFSPTTSFHTSFAYFWTNLKNV